MFNKTLFLAILSGVIVWGLSSCHDHDDADNVTITINKPTVNQAFAKGDSVIVEATLTADAELHGWVVKIMPVGGTTPLFEKDKHTHGTTLNLRTAWANNVATETQAEVEVSAELNHSGTRKETKKVPIVLKKD